MKEKVLTPMKSIRAKCLDCSCGSANEVKNCPIINCALYGYRFGRRPETQARRLSAKKATE